jgi:hypothetical protein
MLGDGALQRTGPEGQVGNSVIVGGRLDVMRQRDNLLRKSPERRCPRRPCRHVA